MKKLEVLKKEDSSVNGRPALPTASEAIELLGSASFSLPEKIAVAIPML